MSIILMQPTVFKIADLWLELCFLEGSVSSKHHIPLFKLFSIDYQQPCYHLQNAHFYLATGFQESLIHL